MGSDKAVGFGCVKFAFFAFNVIFWLLGCAILGIGIWLHISKGTYVSVAPSFSFLSATALCIAAGSIVLVVGFFGCCGALMENQCMLLTYFLMVVVIFVLEIVAGIMAFVYRDEMERVIKQELELGLKNKYPSPGAVDEEGLKAAWDEVQQTFRCCGVSNYTDWYKSNGWSDKNWVPDSCCQFEATGCGRSEKPSQWFAPGCYVEVKFYLRQNLYIVGVAGLTVGVVQVLGMVASMVLFCCLRNDRYYD